MREIKFRGWCEKDSEWRVGSYVYDHSYHEINTMLDNGSLYASQVDADSLGQYTGLKDKNGVEIYEGDVVKILYSDWPSQAPDDRGKYALSVDDYMDSISNIGKVVFKDCCFCIQFNDYGDTGYMRHGPHGQIKVTGNIYENPELLAEADK